ncbi:MAG: AAA family ATPase [Tannerella sp.]|nr:AAA family ATPase [Tannerella sp.]
MNLSQTMHFVMTYARVETFVSGMKEMHPEHLFLGLLKLPGMTAGQISSASGNSFQIEEDIQTVAQNFHQAGIEPENGREKLRKLLFDEKPPGDGETLIAELLTKAAGRTNKDALSAADVLTVLLREPTPLITSAFALDKNSPIPKLNEASEAIKKGEGVKFLTLFSERIRETRHTLLNKVFGQDHAVHAFAEGLFSAEILAEADDGRLQPRAIFVFAGPPGVGKTFLAEQAAGRLSIPFKRFDMSSFADHQAHSNLIGFAPSYKDARPGLLTGFVRDNPYSILLFDEIEKAHLNTIQLFLQILDAGILYDDFLDKTISFKDTIIIFTTNAGKQLYEGEPKKTAAGFSRKTILNALERDVDPQTGLPFFPPTICSRLATGYLILFNHLQACDLEKISEGEFFRSCALFEKRYRIKVDTDPLLSTAILLSEGGWTDARILKAQTGLFFKNEIFKLLGFSDNHSETSLKKIESIRFSISIDDLPLTVKHLFEDPARPEILLFGNALSGEALKKALPDITIHQTIDVYEALRITAERDIAFVFSGIDNTPIPDIPLHKTRNFFNLLRKRVPDMPVYLLIPGTIPANHELLSAFIRAGARDILVLPEENTDLFASEIATIIRQTHRQSIATSFAAQHKTLFFETSIAFSSKNKQAIIHLREFGIRRAIQAADHNMILDEIEKPDVRFDDVVGVSEAKEELSLFIEYLKNPRKFAALGLKPPKGVLLYGPPGTGKTLLAKAMAGESDATFIPASANALVASCQNNGSNAIRELFNRAQRYTPAIIFIDEIEAIGKSGKKSIAGDYEKMALKILLAEMESVPVDFKHPVFILAATNSEIEESNWGSEIIDASLVRRFSRKIRIGLPDKKDRDRYLRMVLDKRKNHQISEHMIAYLTDRSVDFSLADLESVLDLSYRIAAKKNVPVSDKILEEAFDASHPGEKKYWDNEYWRG